MTEQQAPKRRIRGKNREALLDAISDLMTERDTVDISIADISAVSGVNPSLVKYYFGGKDGLLLALLLRIVTNRIEVLRKQSTTDVPPVEKLKQHIQGTVELLCKYPYVNRLVHALMRDGTNESTEQVEREVIRPLCSIFSSLIEEGVQSGDFRPVDGTFCFFTTIGACDYFFSNGYIVKIFYNKKAVDDSLKRRLIEHTTELVLAGISNVRPALHPV